MGFSDAPTYALANRLSTPRWRDCAAAKTLASSALHCQSRRMKLASILPVLVTALNLHGAALRALIINGQNNHDYKSTTPHLKKVLEETGLFTVDIATTPPAGGDMSTFKPEFSQYRVIISNYNGEPWSKETQAAFETFVKNGGGFVSVHAADNAFPDWKEYNLMIGLGGWGDRNEKSGPYLRLRDGKFVQ